MLSPILLTVFYRWVTQGQSPLLFNLDLTLERIFQKDVMLNIKSEGIFIVE